MKFGHSLIHPFYMKPFLSVLLAFALFSCKPESPQPLPEPNPGHVALSGMLSAHPALPSVTFAYNGAYQLSAATIGDQNYYFVWEDDSLSLVGYHAPTQEKNLELRLTFQNQQVTRAQGWEKQGPDQQEVTYEFAYNSSGQLISQSRIAGGHSVMKAFAYTLDNLTEVRTETDGILTEEMYLDYFPDKADKTGRDAWKMLGFSAIFFPEPMPLLIRSAEIRDVEGNEVFLSFSYALNGAGYPMLADVTHSQAGVFQVTYAY